MGIEISNGAWSEVIDQAIKTVNYIHTALDNLESRPSLVRLHLGVAKSSLLQAKNELRKAFDEIQKQESTVPPEGGKQAEKP